MTARNSTIKRRSPRRLRVGLAAPPRYGIVDLFWGDDKRRVFRVEPLLDLPAVPGVENLHRAPGLVFAKKCAVRADGFLRVALVPDHGAAVLLVEGLAHLPVRDPPPA